jgi:CDP-2,3-bis-(O-geranylgeranyl)-sn-glycerol synthase
MQVVLIGKLLAVLAVANGAPVIGKRLLGNTLAAPVDGGTMFADGRPLFGPSKTLRGIAISLLMTPLGALLIGLDWKVGALTAICAMTGDLFSSFLKRRAGLPPSSMAIGLDQIPESLFPLVACRLLLPIAALEIVVAVAIFLIGELILSRLLFRLHIRDRPY